MVPDLAQKVQGCLHPGISDAQCEPRLTRVREVEVWSEWLGYDPLPLPRILEEAALCRPSLVVRIGTWGLYLVTDPSRMHKGLRDTSGSAPLVGE